MADSFGPVRDGDAGDAAQCRTSRRTRRRAEPIRVLVVDDHALFRRGLEIVLAQEEDIQVVGEAGDGAEAVDKAADLLPDIVLMDVRMPRRGGIEACTSIKEVAPSAKIIMLTISDEEADLYEAIKAGRDRLPAQGDLHRRGGHRDPRGRRRPVADQPVDGVQAAHRVQVDDPAHRRAPAGARAAADRPRAGGAQAGRHRA